MRRRRSSEASAGDVAQQRSPLGVVGDDRRLGCWTDGGVGVDKGGERERLIAVTAAPGHAVVELLKGLGSKVLGVEAVLVPVGELGVPAVGLELLSAIGKVARKVAALVL